jgi:hypothetical protein
MGIIWAILNWDELGNSSCMLELIELMNEIENT